MTATPSSTRQKLKPGAVVRCRTRRYLVEDLQLFEEQGAEVELLLKEVLRAQRKRINATVRQRNRDLVKLDRQAAAAEPTSLIPGLEEQLDVPALDLQKLSSLEPAGLVYFWPISG